MTTGIYRLQIGTHHYVGASMNIEVRCRGHISNLRRRRHPNRVMQKAFDEEGSASYEVYQEVDRPNQIRAAEQEAIDAHRDSPLCLNLAMQSAYVVPTPTPAVIPNPLPPKRPRLTVDADIRSIPIKMSIGVSRTASLTAIRNQINPDDYIASLIERGLRQDLLGQLANNLASILSERNRTFAETGRCI